jgi:hypothetical protein
MYDVYLLFICNSQKTEQYFSEFFPHILSISREKQIDIIKFLSRNYKPNRNNFALHPQKLPGNGRVAELHDFHITMALLCCYEIWHDWFQGMFPRRFVVSV